MKKYFALILMAAPLTVWAHCELTVPSIGALRYNAFDAVDQVILMNGTVSCDATSNVRIQVSKGGAPTYSQRAFVWGQNRLAYNLYLGTSETYIWGDGTAGTSEMGLTATTNTPITANVRIPARQNPPVGVYSDTLVFTVIF